MSFLLTYLLSENTDKGSPVVAGKARTYADHTASLTIQLWLWKGKPILGWFAS